MSRRVLPVFAGALLGAVVACNIEPTRPAVGIDPVEPTTADDLTLAILEESVDNTTVSYGVVWYEDGVIRDDLLGETTVPADATARGERWRVSVTPSDGALTGISDWAEVVIGNSPPTATVAIEVEGGAAADTTTQLTAVPAFTDADVGDPVSFRYEWRRNGASTDVTFPVVPASRTLRGDTWQVTVTPNDGTEDGASASASVTLGNATPSVGDARVEPATLREIDVATCVGERWLDPDGDPPRYQTTWLVGGTEVATTATLDGASFDRGDAVSCRLVPIDDESSGDAVTSPPVTVRNSAPTLVSAALDNTEPREGSRIGVEVVGADDPDGDTVSWRVDWYIDDVLAVTSAEIASSVFAKGDVIHAVVTPNDGFVDGESVTSDATTVLNTAPTITSVSMNASIYRTNDTITLTVRTNDRDGDTVGVDYAWYVDSTLVSETGATLSGVDWFDKDQSVYVSVTPWDDEESGTASTTSSVTIDNTAPGAPEVSIDPRPATEDDDLYCEIVADSLDDDGDDVTYSFAWKVGTSTWTGSKSTTTHTGDTIASTYVDWGESWSCTVTPNDGDDDGTTASSSTTVGGLYVADGSNSTSSPNKLYLVDLDAGSYSEVGTMSYGVTGLAFDSSGTLWGVTSGSTRYLVTIDPSDASTTVVATLSYGGSSYSPVPDITWVGGTLYGWSEYGDFPVTIATSGSSAGTVTRLGTSSVGSAGSGMAYNGSGTIYFTPYSTSFYTVNTSTGAMTSIGSVSGITNKCSGLTWFNGYLYCVDTNQYTSTHALKKIDLSTMTASTVTTLPQYIDSVASPAN